MNDPAWVEQLRPSHTGAASPVCEGHNCSTHAGGFTPPDAELNDYEHRTRDNSGERAELVPMEARSRPGLYESGNDPDMLALYAGVADARARRCPENSSGRCWQGQAAGTALPFTILDRDSGRHRRQHAVVRHLRPAPSGRDRLDVADADGPAHPHQYGMQVPYSCAMPSRRWA